MPQLPNSQPGESLCVSLSAKVASAIAYKVGLFAQNPPSASSRISPLLLVIVYVSKKGYAEHDAITASATQQPKKGTNDPLEPCA